MRGRPYRTPLDRVPVPVPAVGGPDNVDRLVAGVRLPGSTAVHAMTRDGRPCCGADLSGELSLQAAQLILTTWPVSCRHRRCAGDDEEA